MDPPREALGPGEFFRPGVLLAGAALMIMYLAALAIAPSPVVVVPLGLLALLFVPGYAVGALLFPGRTELPWASALAIVVGLSVIVNLVLGLAALAYRAGLPPALFAGAAFLLAVAALVLRFRRPGGASTPAPLGLAAVTRLPGLSRGQRRAAFGLLAATALVFVLIVYLSTLHPDVQPAVTLGLEGPGGSVTALPTSGAVGTVLALWVNVTNGGTAQTLQLNVQSTNLSSSSTGYRVVPWTLPLPLANATQSSTEFALQSDQSYVLNLTFSYSYPGLYGLYLTVAQPGGASERTAAVTIHIG